MIVYTPPRTAERLPIIDLLPSFSPERAQRAAVAAEIGNAARDTGFFYIKNHRVDAGLVDGAFALAARFFERSPESKSLVRKRAELRGYEPLAARGLDPASPPDIKESFIFAGAGGSTAAEPVENQWPADVPGFRAGLETYYVRMLDLGRHVLRLLALSLGEPEERFDEAFRSPSAQMSLLRYPPQPAEAAFNQIGAGAHTDWGGITLLAQDARGGLEVQNAAGDWLRAEPVPGTFVVNLGDMMARWTNDVYHSSMHRVMNNRSGTDRQSIVLFLNPAYDTRVECLPTCREASGGIAKYEPCIAGEAIAARYQASRQQRSLPS